MNSKIATLSLSGIKNCFVKIPQSWASAFQKGSILPLRLETENGSVIYVSSQGDATPQDEVIEMNALYAAKHGLQDGLHVVVTPLSNVATCERAFIEPLSVDDWEILELHASYIEGHILDQVRVLWSGQILPLWVNNSICIFVKVGSTEPEGECCIIEQMSELHIAPKDRTNPTPRKQPQQTNRDTTQPLNPQPEPADNPNNPETSQACPEPWLRWLWAFLYRFWFGPSFPEVQNSKVENRIIQYDRCPEHLPLDRGVISSLRVQPGPRKEPHYQRVINGEWRDIPYIASSLQPTCVYISEMSLAHVMGLGGQNKTDLYNLPRTFLAAMMASKSLVEREEIINLKALNKKPAGSKNGQGKKGGELPEEPTKEGEVVVRFVILDIDNKFVVGRKGGAEEGKGDGGTVGREIEREAEGRGGGTEREVVEGRQGGGEGRETSEGSEVVRGGLERVKFRDEVLGGHVMVNDLLRRQMMLAVTSRVCLIPLLPDQLPVSITGLHLHPLFNQPDGITSGMMVTAFVTWITDVTSASTPFVMTDGTLIKIPLLPDFSGEFMLSMEYRKPDDKRSWPDYCLLHSELCHTIKIQVQTKLTNTNKPPSITHLPSWNLQEIDPKVPTVSRVQLGGIDELFDELLAHLRSLLRADPLADHLLRHHHGVRGGGVLVTGAKGCGKSTVTRAICRALAERRPIANVTVIDCKPLRGKRIDSIQKQLHTALSEAAWKQPAVVLLDDLDHIAAAPSGPEQEASGEAAYFTKVAEVVKDLFHREVAEKSSLVVIATSKALETLHVSLTASRGHHFFQKVVNIQPPDKGGRESILRVLLTQRAGVKPAHLASLDLADLADRTEGYVARDLELLVNRAVHAHRMTATSPASQGHQRQPVVGEDLIHALDGFTPMGLRNVTLHAGGDVTWCDVGGLRHVKATLVETLQWPAKYPRLFTNSPLRLRQGLLLYGAPGTGKTLLAGAVAKECGLNFISIKGPELLSKYIGASEQAVRQTFERAQSARPCILFFDEFDSLAPRRGHDSTGVTDRVVNQLLTQLDGVEGLQGVYVLAATSRPDLIDPALLRPGRFDKALNCTLPSKEDREEILAALSRTMRLSDDVNLTTLAESTPHFTGADLKALLYNAQLDSIHESSDLWGAVRDPADPLRHDQQLVIPQTLPEGTDRMGDTVQGSPDKVQAAEDSSAEQEPARCEVDAQKRDAGEPSSPQVDVGVKEASQKELSPQRSTSFEYLLPDGGSTTVNGGDRQRNSSSSGGSSSSDQSVGQSPSWEVVAMVTEKPRGDGGVVRRAGRERLAYIPNVEEGVVALSQCEEEQMINQVKEHYICDVGEMTSQTGSEHSVSLIHQRHLLAAAGKMRPSVSETERRRYLKIYENFSRSKGGNFSAPETMVGQRATLA